MLETVINTEKNNQIARDFKQTIIYKAWGSETLLALNELYCYKKIFIKEGCKTSFQYHNHKLETNYIQDGTAEIWLEGDDGIIEKSIQTSGYSFTVIPPKKHRVIAITDLTLLEVSTPEIWDCIRLQDDYNRKNGRIDTEFITPSVCILLAGKGTRMNELSNYIHKALLPINNKALLTYLIEKFPSNYELILAVGYKSEQIKDYCKLMHADRNITFIDIPNYDKLGSGPGFSLSCCKHLLQKPFYICVGDCYIDGEFPKIYNNWLGYHYSDYPNLYSTFDMDEENNIIDFKNKSKNGFNNAFTGYCYINDYSLFWQELTNNCQHDIEYELVSAFYNIRKYPQFKGIKMNWYDVGTYEKYIDVKNKMENVNSNLFKTSMQFNFKSKNYFIKLVLNKDKLIERSKRLIKYIPEIIDNKTFLCYKFIEGNVLYNCLNKNIFMNFLDWYKQNLIIEEIDLSKECKLFYNNKTLLRINQYLNDNKHIDNCLIINNKTYDLIMNYIEKIDMNKLTTNYLPTKFFHGDLQFDNIIYDLNNEFKYIDWRDEFGGNIDYGDAYYDMAKLYGGILLNYEKMRNVNYFNFSLNNNEINFSINLDDNNLLSTYEDWLKYNNFDIYKIKLLTSLIFLNMAPLHTNNFNHLVFCIGKIMLADLV